MNKLKMILLAVLAAGTAGAAEFHVAPSGSDANPGTADRPFATLERARDAARGIRDQKSEVRGQTTIALEPGRYFFSEPLTLDDRDSGEVWRGEGDKASAKIYGGVPVTGWKKWKGGIWRAPVPKGKRFFNLIVDDKPATMAQTPDKGSGFGGGAWKINNGAVGVPKAWRGYDYSDAQVFCFIGANWFSEMREVLSAHPAANGTLPIDGGSGEFGGMNNRFFIRGVLEFLDEPGEWCLKHDEGYVYYWPKSGTPADHLIVRPTGEKTLDVEGRSPATPAKSITIENLSLIGSDFCPRWYIFRQPKDGTTPAPLQQGMVFGENVEGLTINGCKLLAAGHSAVWLNHYAQNCVIENNLIMDAGFAGVYMNGWDIGDGPFKSGLESYVNKGHRIEDNFIYDCGQFIGAGCGIQLYQSGDNLITRNEIGQMPRYGISCKGERWGCLPKVQYGQKVTFDTQYEFLHSNNNRITGNEIYSVCRDSFDFGGIESWGAGRDNLWAGNDLHDLDPAVDWNGWAHVLFADDANNWLTIRGNIIHHCYGGAATGAFMLKSIEEKIENNLVVDCRIGRIITFAPYVEPCWDVTVRRNIFAVDGVNARYGDMNDYSLHGKSYLDATVPPGASGIKEFDHNFITPADPANPNPYAADKMDLHSVFADDLATCSAPEWDATRFDYHLRQLPGMEFKTSSFADMGLEKKFPFDTAVAVRRLATDNIQAEDYQRMHDLRTIGGTGIGYLTKGAWAKYANIDFGSGTATQAVFAMEAYPAKKGVETFVRHYGDNTVEATPFHGGTITTITQWEVSDSYTMPGKTGMQLFDTAFAPEKDIRAGNWKPWLAPMTSRMGITTAPGVVDLDVANGEKNENACAYLRSSIYTPIPSANVLLSATADYGVKVWLNGELMVAANSPGTHQTAKAVLKTGWNILLVKVNQDNTPRSGEQIASTNFHVKLDVATSAWPQAVFLPGLPTDEKALPAGASELVELRLDAPDGRLIGRVVPGQTTCPVEKVTGIHNVYLVFPGSAVQDVDWFRFEAGPG